MSQPYFALLTAVGEAKLANAVALNVPLQISRMAVGDGGGALPVPLRTQTALIGEQYRADLNSLIPDPLNASQVIAELVIPEATGGWWLREMGLYDAAGDLIAVSNCPPSYKPVVAEGSGKTQVMRMVLIVSSTAAVQLKIDPSVVLATRAYADSLITVHQAAADPHPQYKLRGAVTTLTASATITAAQIGLLLLDASGGSRTFTLPAASAGLGVRELVVRRTDVSANALVIAANGADKLMLDTTAEAAGQASTELLFAGDFLRLRSDGAGKWWCVGQAQLPGSLSGGLRAYSAAGANSFVVPPVLRSGRRQALVTVVGAGGGGGGAAPSVTYNAAAGGGGGGGTAIKYIDLTGVSSVSVTVGAGGGGGTAAPVGGGGGGSSSFGAYCSATGGTGGIAAQGGSSSTQVGGGGAGGAGAGGNLNIRGALGGTGGSASPSVAGATVGGGDGGHTMLSATGAYGAGGQGGGTFAGSGPVPGNAGSPGVVTIQW